MNRGRRALTTGRAAEYCFVTADTIANWIRSGLLPAQRTAGGQYRILAGDLHAFMTARGMSTAALEEEEEIERVPCWEFRRGASFAGAGCDDCVVRHLKVLDCFKLMAMRSAGGWPVRDCADCPYFLRYGTPPEGREER
jgi:excisionase family DNA binding protein